MPAHRIPGPGDGWSVFAYVSELHAWLSGQDHEAPTDSMESEASVNGAWQRWAWVLSLAVVTTVAPSVALRLAPSPDEVDRVARVTATGDIVTAYSAEGEVLWARRHPQARAFRKPSQTFRLVDLHGVPGRVVLLASNTTAERGDDYAFGESLSLSESGELQWSRSAEDVIRFGERSFSGPWMSGFLFVVNVDGEDLILWGVNHTTWWPSVVLMMTPDGDERGRFVNSGWVTAATSVPSAQGDLPRSPDRPSNVSTVPPECLCATWSFLRLM